MPGRARDVNSAIDLKSKNHQGPALDLRGGQRNADNFAIVAHVNGTIRERRMRPHNRSAGVPIGGFDQWHTTDLFVFLGRKLRDNQIAALTE